VSVSVEFIEVGRKRLTWIAEMGDTSDPQMLREIRRSGALMSQDVDVQWERDGYTAHIFVGLLRLVGTARVLRGGPKQ
jgi:hypothetical protein